MMRMARGTGRRRARGIGGILMAAAVVLLTACQASADTGSVVSGPVQLAEGTASLEGQAANGTSTLPSPTLAAATEEASSNAPDSAAEDLRLDQVGGVHLASDGQEGWIWGTSGDSFGLFRTTNGGQDWQSAAPDEGWTAADAATAGPNVFLTKEQGIIVSWTDEKGLHLSLSEDGGASWRSALIDAQEIAVSVQFQDDKPGWMLADGVDAALGHTLKEVYRTEDGGRTWSVVSSDGGYIPNPNETPEALPQLGQVSGMSFADAKRGWVGIDNGIDANIHLYQSVDSGHSWHEMKPELPEGIADDKAYAVPEAPRFFDAEKKNGAFTVVFKEEDRARVAKYETTDGGATWSRPIELFAGEKADRDGTLVTFSTMQDGAAYWGGKLRTTSDGGRNWTVVDGDGTLGQAMKRMPQVQQLAFADMRTGWLLTRTSDEGNAWSLLGTSDGGSSWKELAAGGLGR